MDMKEIKTLEPIYIEKYDIHVNPYLTYAQIQQIIDSTKELDTWTERKQNIDMLLLYHATDISKEKLEELGHDVLIQSGLIDVVEGFIWNRHLIDEGLEYTESIQRSLAQIAKELPQYMNPLQEVMKKYGNKSSQK